MKIVPAKCPFCGGTLQVDSEKDAAICEYCKQPFIVEKAINNYNTNVTNNYYDGATFLMQNNSNKKPSDYLIVECGPSELTACIDLHRTFGYEFVTKDHSPNSGIISVTFRRFREIENYEKLCELEKKYNYLNKTDDLLRLRSKAGCAPFFIVGGVFTFIAFSFFAFIGSISTIAGVVFLIIGLILLASGILFVSLISSENTKINEKKISIKNETAEIISEAKRYQNNSL